MKLDPKPEIRTFVDADLPFVSAVIPCRNEEKHLGQMLDSILANGYPMDKIEVLVVDGMSEDASREIVARYHAKYPGIRLVDNPKRILAAAWNNGVKAARGSFVFAMNAHAKVEPGYFRRCIEYLHAYEADVAGPVIITHPQDEHFAGKLIAAALSHRFGVGNSRFRTGTDVPTWVDTVHMGCYRRDVFERNGFFNEELVRSQDIDFHNRLVAMGGKILLVPEIKIHYYTRSNLKVFLKYGFINGYWATRPYSFGAAIAGPRHLVPMVFFLALVLPLLIAAWLPEAVWLTAAVLAAYFSLAFAVSAVQALSAPTLKSQPLATLFSMPLVFFAIHFPYGVGSAWGMLRALGSPRFWQLVKGRRGSGNTVREDSLQSIS